MLYQYVCYDDSMYKIAYLGQDNFRVKPDYNFH